MNTELPPFKNGEPNSGRGLTPPPTDCGQLIATLSSMETGLTELLKYDFNSAWEGFIDNNQGFIASRKR